MSIPKHATLFLATLALSCQAFAVRPMVSPRYHRMHRFRRVPWNPVFKPSHESQLPQLIASGELVAIIPNQSLRIQPSLDRERRFCRPWTLDFVQDISEAYYKEFHQQIQVNSAVRTVLVQKKLRRHNRNAAPETGETASSHLAGLTVDLQRRGMTKAQVKWIEEYLRPLKEMGLIEPEEERRHWCFHIMVAGSYDDYRQMRMLATQQDPSAALLEITSIGLPTAAPTTQQSALGQ